MTDSSSPDVTSVQADLAFLRTLVEGGDDRQAAFGAAYMFAGIAYGLQTLVQWLAYLKILPIEETPIYLVVVTVPTIALIVFTSWQGWTRRKRRAPTPAGRAIEAVFQGAGLANLAIIIAIVAAAVGLRAYMMIFVYAAVIFALQGACWFVVWRLKRQGWMLAVALGWLLSGVALGWVLGQGATNLFIAICLFDIWFLMALPGAVLLHSARKASS